MQYAPNPVTPLEIAVTGVLTVVGVAGVVGGVLVSRKAAASHGVEPPPSGSPESQGPYLSGPFRDNDGVVLTRGMLVGDGDIGKVRRVTAFLGFAYVTVEVVRTHPDHPDLKVGQFLWAVQIAAGSDEYGESDSDTPYLTESAAAGGARAWITANRSRLVAGL